MRKNFKNYTYTHTYQEIKPEDENVLERSGVLCLPKHVLV